LLDAGQSLETIAEYLFLSCNTVTNYLNKYQTSGLEDLVSDDYQGSKCRLSEVQQGNLAQHLEETLYQTVFSIREYIQVTYNVTYSLSGLRHFLHQFDFVYKKSKAVPGKADNVAQEEFSRLIEAKLTERYYKNRKVKAFLETSKVQIIFLPLYSPNLNLIERLWRLLKKIVLHDELRMGGTMCDLLISKQRF